MSRLTQAEADELLERFRRVLDAAVRHGRHVDCAEARGSRELPPDGIDRSFEPDGTWVFRAVISEQEEPEYPVPPLLWDRPLRDWTKRSA